MSREAAAALMCRLGCRTELLQSRARAKVPTELGGGQGETLTAGADKQEARQAELDTFTFHFHALEKEMATHSSVLAWRIPGTGEPVGLPSMGSHRVGHD